MKGECKICGCTETTPCFDEVGIPCAWVTSDLCDACVIYVNTGSERGGQAIVPKECRYCTWLKEGFSYRKKSTWTCSKGRFDQSLKFVWLPLPHWYSWSGIWRPNKTVKAAQKQCPYWELFPGWSDVTKQGRPEAKNGG